MTSTKQNDSILDPLTDPKGSGVSKLLDVPEKVVGLINRIPTYIFVFSVLVLFFFRFTLHINEEHYLPLAKQFYQPDWLSGSFTFTEPASTRVLYQYFAGFLLSFLSFEVVSAVGVLLMALGIALPITRIYNLFQFSNVEILLHLPLLYIARESFIGAESVLLSFEPKSPAYIFLFFGLYYMFTERYRPATLFIAASTYFHILVGGWFMLYLLLYHLITERSLKKTIALGLLFTACMAPFLVYLYPSIQTNFSKNDYPVNLDWVFSYFLHPFHAGLFKDPANFQKGFLISLALISLCVFVFPRFKEPFNRKLNLFNILLFSGTSFALVLAYFDKNGSFVKYLPFRINTLLAFLIYLQIIYLFRQYFLKKEMAVYFQFGVLAFFMTVPFVREVKQLVFDDVKPFLTNTLVERPYQDVINYIRENTAKEDVFLLLSKNATPDDYYSYDLTVDFVRRAERDQFIIFLAGPASVGSEKMYLWYQRINAKKEIIEDLRNVCSAKEKYRLNYILTDYLIQDDACYDLVYRNDVYHLYKIRIDP